MAKRTNRVAWGLAAVLVVTLLGACGVGGVWLRSYWVAKHYGPQADLHGSWLPFAPLAGAKLIGADLQWAHLHGADLREPSWSART